MSNNKILIAYYSHSGNTKEAAEKIQTITGGDIFDIQPVNKYSNNYNEVVNQAKIEKQNDTRPELINNGDIQNYDIIFVGTPVWWYTMASPVKTFLASHNWDNKVIVPFCTHGGGGASNTYRDIQKFAQNAKVLNGYTSYENSAKIEDIKTWINNLNL